MEEQVRKARPQQKNAEVKFVFYRTQIAFALAVRVAQLYNQHYKNIFQPLFPLFVSQEGSQDFSLPFKKALGIVESIMQEQQVSEEQMEAIRKNFEQCARDDYRQQKKEQILLQQVKQVNLDVICCFLMEQVAEIKSVQIQQFFTGIKIAQSERRNPILSLEEFTKVVTKVFPSAGAHFAEECFTKFYLGNANCINQVQEEQRKVLIQELLEFMLENTTQPREFYLKQQVQSPTKPGKSDKGKLAVKTKPQSQIFDQVDLMPQQLHVLTSDYSSSHIVLEESYENVKNLIRSEETKDDRIKYEHENLRTVLQKIQMLAEEPVSEQRIADQNSQCEKGWASIRKLLEYINPKMHL